MTKYIYFTLLCLDVGHEEFEWMSLDMNRGQHPGIVQRDMLQQLHEEFPELLP
jgi:hypothetical protein